MSPLLFCAIGLVRGWTRLCTWRMDAACRDDRRAEIESDLWELHEDARRRRCSPEGIAIHMLARLCAGVPHDLLWRLEYEQEPAHRRPAWLTAASAASAAGIATLWIVFLISTFVSLPPLPDSGAVVRVFIRATPAPPPPPPPPPQPPPLKAFRIGMARVPPPPPPR
jgi:hypothetical protein